MWAASETARQTRGRTLDHAAGLYDWLSPACTFGREGRIQGQAIELLELPADCRVLDVGCATGRFSRRIAAACPDPGRCEVVAIDAADRMIAVARQLYGSQANLRFEAALAERLPFADQCFDRIVSSFFFHHVDAELKRRCLAEMHRTLKPGGRAVIVDVDIPTTWFGSVCAWSGYVLFQQGEIRENIRGVLREAFATSAFRSWRQVSHHCGYISVFVLER
jgi:ubiquinone/menaquinone biosynthesis C-methylase UbiE